MRDGRPARTRSRPPSSPLASPLVRIERLLVANRGEIARARLPGLPRARDRDRRRRRAGRPRLAARARRPTRRSRSRRTSTRRARARGAGDRRRRDPSRLRLPRRERATSPRRSRRPGSTWVGPPPAALRAGGDKLEAKRIAREAGVPVVPEGEPDEIGFPLMVKAAAGGGGRGMRVVRAPDELDEALAAARREAKAGVRRRPRLLRALRRAAAARRDPAARRRARARSSRSASASARCSAATRRCSRSRPRPRSTRSCARG